MKNSYENKTIFAETIYEQEPDQFFEQIVQFRELMMMYNSAIREVTTKLEILNDELSLESNKNPIEFIKARVKKPMSIVNKLKRNGQDITIPAIVNTLNDVAGIRVVCSFVDDVYKIAEMLIRQDDITLITVKDYIKNPKPNGYRSYHLIIEVPVFFSDRKQPIRVEVQIRTVAMDFWASLEHRLKYKQDLADSDIIGDELKACAETIANTDQKMMDIRNRIEKLNHK